MRMRAAPEAVGIEFWDLGGLTLGKPCQLKGVCALKLLLLLGMNQDGRASGGPEGTG